VVPTRVLGFLLNNEASFEEIVLGLGQPYRLNALIVWPSIGDLLFKGSDGGDAMTQKNALNTTLA